MKQFCTSVFLFLIISLSGFAQHSVQSTVYDSKNSEPIEMGSVRLLRAPDSTFVQGCTTDMQGNFQMSKIKPGSYILVVSNIGYRNYYKNIVIDTKSLVLKNIQLVENSKMLGEVEVKGTSAQMVVKNDTLEYNANAFKTANNAVVEDLLKKMPGVEISTDGKITVNGQEIKKVRVNGKKFFGDDIEMATKNIPAESIDKVQVYEQKSDMAQLTGFEDNDTERIINLTFKANRKHGVFGNIVGGVGSDLGNDDNKVRYDGNSFVNIMDNDNQTAITGGGNNTNTTRSMRGRFGGAGQNSGVTTTQNFGINNNSTVNPNLKIGGDASFNHSANESITQTNKESYLKNSVYNDSSSTTSHNGNYSYNLRLEAEWKPDTLTTFVFQPTINYNQSTSDSNSDFTYMTDSIKQKTSWGQNSNYGNGSSLVGGLNVIFNRKFAKKGRTLTANLQTGISQNDNDSHNYSLKNTLDTITNVVQTTKVDQFTRNNSNQYNYSLRVSFVEPLWNVKNLLETAVSYRSNISSSDKSQYNNDGTGNYNLKDTTYSNTFESTFYSETMELNFRHTEQYYNMMLGLKGEPSQTSSLRTYADGETKPYDTKVFNFAPSARFQYNFGKKKFVRIDYRGQTNQPSISQMVPVKNNSNLMNETVGNPDLLPSFTHNFRMFYSSYNDITFSSFNAMLSADATKDALVSNSIYDATGKQYNQTVNAGVLPYNINGNIMYNIPIIQKRLHFNTATSGSFQKRYGYSSKGLLSEDIDVDHLRLGDLSSTKQYSANQQLSLTFTNDVLEIGVRSSVRYSNTENNLNPTVAQTWDWTQRGNLVFHLPYTFNISSDINYSTHSGYSNFDQNELIWNASIDKTFFNGKGVVALKCFDILHQQLNIRQTIGDNYIQYSRYNTITSYCLLSFAYKINKFNGTKNPAETDMNRFGPGNRPRGEGGFREGGGFRRGGGGGPQD